jgi:hypothetical protein
MLLVAVPKECGYPPAIARQINVRAGLYRCIVFVLGNLIRRGYAQNFQPTWNSALPSTGRPFSPSVSTASQR